MLSLNASKTKWKCLACGKKVEVEKPFTTCPECGRKECICSSDGDDE